MGNCCYCCLGEEEKMQMVLKKFQTVSVSQAMDNNLMKLVGRVVLAGGQPFYAPATSKPCVYYKVTVEEELIREKYTTDQDGYRNTEYYNEWVKICTEEKFVDFYLQDGPCRVFVNGANRGQCKIQSKPDAVGDACMDFFSFPPPGIARLIATNCPAHNWEAASHRTGQFRYTQVSFDVNDLLCGLGVVTPAVDPYSNTAVKILNPIRGNSLSEQYFVENKWEEDEVRAWNDLVASCPSVLLSDDIMITSQVNVPPILNLPQWMQPNAFQIFGYNMQAAYVMW